MTTTKELVIPEMNFEAVVAAKKRFEELLHSAKEDSKPLLPRRLTEASTLERTVMHANSERLYIAWIQLINELTKAEFLYYVDDVTYATYVTTPLDNTSSIPATPLSHIEWIDFETEQYKLNTVMTTDYTVPADFLERFLKYIDCHIELIQKLDSDL